MFIMSKNLETKYTGLSEYYDIGKPIGEGTFGKVRKGVHKLSGVEVAIKILVKKKIVDVSDVERVSREIKILKKLRHLNVIRLYQVIDTRRYIFLIMEYASGGELFDYIVSKTRLNEVEACTFFHMIVNGVEYCHKSGVIHRDLKPENLLLDKHKTIKIVDFGLGNTTENSRLLKTACGSPCYAAPEMIAGKAYIGESADIWSLGVILYALLCGYLPFEDPNTSILYRKILRGQFQCPKWVSSGAHNLLKKIMNTNPKQRYTIKQIRKHDWYKRQSVLTDPLPSKLQNHNNTDKITINNDIINIMETLGYDINESIESIKQRRHNHYYATYHLLNTRQSMKLNTGNVDKILSSIKSSQNINNFLPIKPLTNITSISHETKTNSISIESLNNSNKENNLQTGSNKKTKIKSRTRRKPSGSLTYRYKPSSTTYHKNKSRPISARKKPTTQYISLTARKPISTAISNIANRTSKTKYKYNSVNQARPYIPKLNLSSLTQKKIVNKVKVLTQRKTNREKNRIIKTSYDYNSKISQLSARVRYHTRNNDSSTKLSTNKRVFAKIKKISKPISSRKATHLIRNNYIDTLQRNVLTARINSRPSSRNKKIKTYSNIYGSKNKNRMISQTARKTKTNNSYRNNSNITNSARIWKRQNQHRVNTVYKHKNNSNNLYGTGILKSFNKQRISRPVKPRKPSKHKYPQQKQQFRRASKVSRNNNNNISIGIHKPKPPSRRVSKKNFRARRYR